MRIFQGLSDEIWPLRHWSEDIFTWLPDSRDVLASRGWFIFQSPDYHKIEFGVSEAGVVESLTWIHEGWNNLRGDRFYTVDKYAAQKRWEANCFL